MNEGGVGSTGIVGFLGATKPFDANESFFLSFFTSPVGG